MNKPISVIMPVYNGEIYLEDAIKSILNQTLQNFEFIIINDGSKDNSLEIIEKYASVDDRIIVINRENRGLVATLNEGINVSRGKYIARMDQDDICLPHRFAKQLKFLENNPEISICGSWIETFGDEKHVWKLPIKHDNIKAKLILNSAIVHPAVMLRKTVFDKFLYEEEYNKAEDYALWVKIIDSFKFYNIPEVLLKYRIHDSQTNIIEQRVVAKKIRTIMLDKINCHLNSQEFDLLNRIAHCDELLAADIKASNRLFKKILQANATTKYFVSQALFSILQFSMCCPLKKSLLNKVSLSLSKLHMLILIFWYCRHRIIKD